MSDGIPTHSARSVTYLAAELDDPDGVMTSLATAASPVVFDAADFDGALVTDSGTLWLHGMPRSITISRSDAVGSYTTTDIVITGKRGGVSVTETLTPADADGNDIIRGAQLWDVPPTVSMPAQADTSGAFMFGVGDIGNQKDTKFTGIRLRAAGQVNVQFGESTTAPTDSFASASGTLEPIAFTRVLTDPLLAAPTAVDLTVYAP